MPKCLALLLLIFLPLQVQAAATEKRIVLLQSMPVPIVVNHCRQFVAALAELGYQQGENLRLTLLQADGDPLRAEALLRQALEKGPVDLVVTSATLAAQVAKKVLAGRKIPQLFFTVTDPVGAGLVNALDQPSGELITGKVYYVPSATKLALLEQLLSGSRYPQPYRLGFIHSSYSSALADLDRLQTAAEQNGKFRVRHYMIDYQPAAQGLSAMLQQVAAAIQELEEQIDFWWEPRGALGEAQEYSVLLRQQSARPILYGTTLADVRNGALLLIGSSELATGWEAAKLADQILRGADAGSLPVSAPSRYDLAINLDTADELGLIIPSEILRLAGKNLFRKAN